MVVTPYTRQCFHWAAATVIFAQFWSNFLQKAHAVYIAEREDNIYCRNWGPKFILTPQIGWILRAVSLFKNWRALFKIKGQRLWWSHRLTIRSAIGWVRSSVWKRRLFLNWGAPLNSGKLAGIRQYSNEDATDNELISNYFAQIEGRPSILEN